jgi:amino acid adenylation domain-containing protein
MTQLAQKIEGLSLAKRALLEKKLRERIRVPQEDVTIPVRADQEFAPLTTNQKSLLFLSKLNPSDSTYNLSDAMRLNGKLHEEALQKTLERIFVRHDSLRTTVVEINGEPKQKISASQVLPFSRVDFSQFPSAEREEKVLKFLSAEAGRAISLDQSLSFFSLVKLDEEEHVLFIRLHHIISDGWSLGIFWNEFAQFYSDYAQQQSPLLTALPIQFGDYAAWSLQHENESAQQQLQYWKNQLADAPALLELPTDRPRPAVQSFRGAQVFGLFPTRLHRELKALNQREGVTMFMTLLAIFNILLTRYTEQEDVVVGAPIAGRTRTETESLIGFFVNTLVLRSDVSGNPTFREILQRTKETTLDAFSNQDFPFEKLVAELRPERSLSHNPIFQTAFALQPETNSSIKIPGLELSPIKISSVTSKFDLFLSVNETADGLRITIEYSTDLFDEATMQRFLQHYQNLLEGIVADPSQRLSELPLLSATELQQILVEWNNTATEYPRDVCLHQLFEAQVERTPDAVAIRSNESQVSYRELNRRANQVAHVLRAAGIKPDTLIGLYIERSVEMVIGVLGILKAGGAYLPLDPAYPQSRLTYMLSDAKAPIILTQRTLQTKLPETTSRIICLDEKSNFSEQNDENLTNVNNAEDLAYVIYTSGSTGQPKGSAIVHRGVSRLVINTNYVQLNSSDVMAQVSNISFDAATFELWGALLNGAQLAIIEKDIALSPQDFAEQLRTQKITTMFLTTALFNLLSREVPTAFATLKTLIIGGDACDPSCCREVLKNGAPERLLNGYGPTESTTFAIWHHIKNVGEGSIPVGRPIAQTTIFILDRYMNPVPVGVPGEIYIGGDGLAREYLNQPEMTEERFQVLGVRCQGASHTRHLTPETSLYKTGDIARYLPDGTIEFIGRKDHQVKLRGFRIELGEIENVLLTHPEIREVVLLVDVNKGDKKLVAYYIAAATLSVSELREFLKQRLPDYMIPSAWVRMEQFPLTPNGKIDRKKLPSADQLVTESNQELIAAKDELEVRLIKIWEEVLGVHPIGVRDNFFELGGHSLIAVRLFSAIQQAFGKQLPLAVLFQSPTIEHLAKLLREQGWEPSWNCLVPLRPAGTAAPFFCVHAVGGNVLEYNALVQHFESEHPFYGLQAVGLDGKTSPLTSIEEMAAHYLAEVRQLQPQGPYYLGGRSFGGSVAFEMARQLNEQGEKVALLAMFDTYPLGWLKLFSTEEAKEYQKKFLRLRLQQHCRNLMSLTLRGKAQYIIGKAQFKTRKIKNIWWRLTHKNKLDSSLSLADILRKIEEINFLAVKKYVPQVYDGNVTFFCAEEEVSVAENITGWQVLAAGGVKVVRVSGDHQTMIKEPHVQELARQLTQALSQVQSENTGENNCD